MQNPDSPCDMDDVLCQLETLRHLRGLQREMGKEVFINRFPEFAELGNRISDEITIQEDSLTKALRRCQGQPDLTEYSIQWED